MNYKRIFYYYSISVKKHKWIFFAMLFVYGLAVVLSNTIHPLIFKNIIDTIQGGSFLSVSKSDLLKLVFIFGANILVYNIFYRAGDFLISAFEARSMRDIAKDTFDRLTKHSYHFYTNTFTGSLIAKSKRLVNSFEGIIDRISYDFYFITLRLVGIFIVLFIQVPKFGFLFLLWFLVYLVILFFFLKQKKKYDLESAEADTKFTAVLADIISNILNLKIFSSQGKEKSYFKDVNENAYNKTIKNWNIVNIQLAIQGFFIALLQFGSLYFMITLWLKGEVSTGTVVLVQTYMMLLFDSLWNMGRAMMRFTKDISYAKEMVDIFDMPVDILDPENPEKLKVKDGEIRFENVSFEYTGGVDVFKNFNLHIKKGEKVGLVGHSGSGKSTITKMLLRFLDVKEGSITIDGQNIKNITQDDLRSVISYVPQEPILFHRSIFENISYSKDGATKQEVEEASINAHAHEFISGLQHGYETLVGERGVKLSGGERQRVAIARAMLKDAPILVLDEATSSLDSISEGYIQQAFVKLMEGRTTIVIAHRLSTIQKMDRILVLDKGEIIEQGTHSELLEKKGQYAKLWESQTGGFLQD